MNENNAAVRKGLLLTGCAIFFSGAVSSEALGQTASGPAGTAQPAENRLQEVGNDDAAIDTPEASDGLIIVTGTRLETERLQAPAPVVVLDDEFLVQNTGSLSVGDELSDLPQFAASNNQAASAGFSSDSQVGLNLLDLRGLGPSRTLVLVNGRRLVSSSQQSAQPDTNTIPVGLLSRVEVLTGGASAIYGADAIAGVVNFVLRDDFDGLEGTFRGGLSDEGDAGTYSANITWGRNFAGGRGNIAANAEYSKTEALFYTDRAHSAVQTSFAPDFSPDAQFTFRLVRDLRLIGISTGGTIIDPSLNVFRFAPDGTLNTADFGLGSVIPFGPIISEGGDGLNSIEDQTLLPELERVGLNILGHYDLSPTARVFVEGTLVRLTAGSTSQPSSAAITSSIDNPFLSNQARNLLTGTILEPGSTSFTFSRANRDLGTPQVENERLTMRGVIGVEGDLSDEFEYELFYSFGRTELETRFFNNVINARIPLAADAVVDSAGVLGTPGAVVCRSTLLAAGASGNPDIDSCVPANFFGNGAVSQAARDYITFTSIAEGVLTQNLFGGFVSGDSSGFLQLPGGPIGLVAGAEYRTEKTNFEPDSADLAGGTSRAGIQAIRGSFEVIEGFAEVSAPIIADVPMAHLLEISGAARVAHYDLPGVGTSISWGLGGIYAPVPAVRFRGSYQRSVRAPNVAELFAPVTPVSFSVFDPCDASTIDNGPPQRRANCVALGAPDGFVASTTGSFVNGTTGGNPNLDVERGRTWTAGVVLAPFRDLSVTVDYYNIDLEDAISRTSASTILRLCVDSPSVPNQFCDLVTRDPATFDVAFIREGTANISRLTARGVDVDARYSFDLAGGRMLLSALGSLVIERNNYLDPSAPEIATEILREIGTPKWRANFNSRYSRGPVSLSYNLRYFSDAIRSFAGSRLSEGDLPPDLLTTGDTFIHDIAFEVRPLDRISFFGGIDNLFEADLPPGIYGAGFGGANYDAIGRYFYGGIKAGI